MTFNSLVTLVEKDLKLFFRSRVSSVIIIIMPLLIILLAGHGFNSNQLSGVSVGVYSDSYSNVTESILSGFEENGFIVKKQDSLDDCINSVKISNNQICATFPPDLSYSGSNEKVAFYVDYSRTNLAYTLINLVSEKVSSEASDLGTVMVQNLIDTLNSVRSSLVDERAKLDALPTGLDEVSIMSQNFTNPTDDLTKVIASLEGYEKSGDISSQISSLKTIKNTISGDFNNIDGLYSKTEELKTEVSSAIDGIDAIISSLNSIEIGNASNIVSPIKIDLNSITPVSSNREYLIPIIIALISLFGAILISSTFVLKNKKTLAYFRNFVTPTKDLTFVLATYITCMIILVLQFLLVFLGLYFIFGMNFFSLPLEILSVLILGWSAFIFIGMFLGYAFRSEETVIFSSVLVSSILMFFSSLILPLENISGKLFKIASYNPFVVLVNSLKKVYLFGLSFDSIWVGLVVLGGFFIVFGVLTYFMRRMTKRVL